MKAGLVTFYHIHHYGALLQAAATERAVERFGWDCEIIDYFVNQDNALLPKRPHLGLGIPPPMTLTRPCTIRRVGALPAV